MIHAKLHRDAMEAADEYDRMQRSGDRRGALAALQRAADLESRAAEQVPRDLEPTRSVLFRSAASLAAELGDTLGARMLIIEGLRGSPPIAIKAELFALLDEISPRDTRSMPRSGPRQRLRIRSAREPASAIDLNSVTRIQTEWIRTIRAYGSDAQLVPIAATIGSFVIQLEFREDEFAGMKDALHALAEANRLQAHDREAPGRKRTLLALLVALAEAEAILDVSTEGPGAEDLEPIELRAPAKDELKRLQDEVVQLIPSNDIPQADDLERVFEFIALLASGKYPSAADLQIVPRQVAYYRRAAEILGYVRDGSLTPAGKVLDRFPPAERWRNALAHFLASDVGSGWLIWSGQQSLDEVDPDSAEAFLEAASTGLSDITLRRRARTLKTWHTELLLNARR